MWHLERPAISRYGRWVQVPGAWQLAIQQNQVIRGQVVCISVCADIHQGGVSGCLTPLGAGDRSAPSPQERVRRVEQGPSRAFGMLSSNLVLPYMAMPTTDPYAPALLQSVPFVCLLPSLL